MGNGKPGVELEQNDLNYRRILGREEKFLSLHQHTLF